MGEKRESWTNWENNKNNKKKNRIRTKSRSVGLGGVGFGVCDFGFGV